MSWSLPVNIVCDLLFNLSSHPCPTYLLSLVVMEVNHEVIEMDIYFERVRAFCAKGYLL